MRQKFVCVNPPMADLRKSMTSGGSKGVLLGMRPLLSVQFLSFSCGV